MGGLLFSQKRSYPRNYTQLRWRAQKSYQPTTPNRKKPVILSAAKNLLAKSRTWTDKQILRCAQNDRPGFVRCRKPMADSWRLTARLRLVAGEVGLQVGG